MGRNKLKQADKKVAICATINYTVKKDLYKYCKDNHINSISKMIEVLIAAFLDKAKSDVEDQPKELLYTQQELIEFGNYLLSEERKESYILTMQESMKQVHNSDIYNAFDKSE